MKKLLIMPMLGLMLTGVGCKQTDKVAEDIEKNTKQIEETQEETKENKKNAEDEERYEDAVEYLEGIVAQGDERYGFIITREDNTITMTMHLDTNGYILDDILALGYTKDQLYTDMQFETIIDVIDTFAATGQVETRRQYGRDINIVVDSYFGEDRVYCVTGDGEVLYNYFEL